DRGVIVPARLTGGLSGCPAGPPGQPAVRSHRMIAIRPPFTKGVDVIPGPGTLRRFGTSLVAAAAVALTLPGCAAGQHTQTAEQTPVVDGAEAMAGPIALRNVSVVAPDNQVYNKGDSAALQGVIINTGGVDDQLVRVTSDVANSVQVGSGANVDLKAGQ